MDLTSEFDPVNCEIMMHEFECAENTLNAGEEILKRTNREQKEHRWMERMDGWMDGGRVLCSLFSET